MAKQVAGFPYFELVFDEGGKPGKRTEDVVAGVAGATDLLIFSHGWNNSPSDARDLYGRFYGSLRDLFSSQSGPADGRSIAVAGVIWPSMRWADEQPWIPEEDAGGAAGLGPSPAQPAVGDMVRGLRAVFKRPAQRKALDEMAGMLEGGLTGEAAPARFQALMKKLVTAKGGSAPEDEGELAGLLREPARQVFERMATAVPTGEGAGGAAGLGDLFSTITEGAKMALRQLTYFEMKQRAGVVGQGGLGPLVGRIAAANPGLQIHLIGHSFGARLVSFSLAGLPADCHAVKTLFLLQGAFSHFAFADSLPHDAARGGALAGMMARVDGPLVATHTVHDTAVGKLYPVASFTAGQDASAVGDDVGFRWGAIGHDGAQAVGAPDPPLGAVGTSYPFSTGAFTNLNGDDLMNRGGPPSGAHGDIVYPEIAWALAQAAKLI
ncbi:MAG: serine-threonine protein kinase [Chloroflexota bacterium]